MILPTLVLSAPDIQFDGEVFVQQFTNNTSDVKLAEYVRPNETLKNWTKLIAVRNFIKLNDTKSATVDLAKIVQQHNPQAKFQIFTKDDGSEAQIDFLTWPREGKYMEFNVHRYMKVRDYPGLISYQFAYRFSDTSPNAKEAFMKNRQRWINEMFKAKFATNFDK
jgi:hypothetical protein